MNPESRVSKAVPADATRRQETVPVAESSRIKVTKRVVYTLEMEEGLLDDLAQVIGKAENYDLDHSAQRARSEFFEACQLVMQDRG